MFWIKKAFVRAAAVLALRDSRNSDDEEPVVGDHVVTAVSAVVSIVIASVLQISVSRLTGVSIFTDFGRTLLVVGAVAWYGLCYLLVKTFVQMTTKDIELGIRFLSGLPIVRWKRILNISLGLMYFAVMFFAISAVFLSKR